MFTRLPISSSLPDEAGGNIMVIMMRIMSSSETQKHDFCNHTKNKNTTLILSLPYYCYHLSSRKLLQRCDGVVVHHGRPHVLSQGDYAKNSYELFQVCSMMALLAAQHGRPHVLSQGKYALIAIVMNYEYTISNCMNYSRCALLRAI